MAALFDDANNEYLAMGAVYPDSSTAANALTFSAWVCPDATGIVQTIHSKYSTATLRSWMLRFETGNTLSWYHSHDGTFVSANTTTSAGTFTANEWNHVAARFDGSGPQVDIWLNGTKTTNAGATSATLHANAAQNRMAGQSANPLVDPWVSNEFSGKMEHVAIWYDVALADHEVESLQYLKPIKVAGAKLSSYWPLTPATLRDLVSGIDAAGDVDQRPDPADGYALSDGWVWSAQAAAAPPVGGVPPGMLRHSGNLGAQQINGGMLG